MIQKPSLVSFSLVGCHYVCLVGPWPPELTWAVETKLGEVMNVSGLSVLLSPKWESWNLPEERELNQVLYFYFFLIIQ